MEPSPLTCGLVWRYLLMLEVAVCLMVPTWAETKVCRLSEEISGVNLGGLSGCTVIDGDLRISADTFKKKDGTPEVTVADLEANLGDVREIRGGVVIATATPELRDLSFLGNLHTIHNATKQSEFSLRIYNTHILYLGLRSLRHIDTGRVLITRNQDLCYVESINWHKILRHPHHQKVRISRNRQPEECEAGGAVCDYICRQDGCWGSGNDQCVSCADFVQSGRCISSCDQGFHDAGNKTCLSPDSFQNVLEEDTEDQSNNKDMKSSNSERTWSDDNEAVAMSTNTGSIIYSPISLILEVTIFLYIMNVYSL